MSRKKRNSAIASGALGGAGTGAAAGSVAGPWGAAIGAGIGAIGGGFAGYMASEADDEDPENQEIERRARGMQMFRANLSRALKGRRQPATFGEMLNG